MTTVKLVSKVSLDQTLGYVNVVLMLETSAQAGERWGTSQDVGLECFSIKKSYGGMMPLEDVARKIVKAQKKLLAHFKTNSKYYDLANALCAHYSHGEVIVQDSETTNFIKHFTK